MKNILCVRWGDKYSAADVEKLRLQIKEHCSLEYRFFCLTDRPSTKYDIKLPTKWDKYYDPTRNSFWAYRKCYMFNEELFPRLDGDDFLYLDLDVKIHSSINTLFELDDANPTIVRGWWNDLDHCIKNYSKLISTPINSSIIQWTRGQLLPIYKHIDKHSDYVFFTFASLDNYFNHFWYDIHNEAKGTDKSSNTNKDLFRVFDPGVAYSWYKGNIFPDDMEIYKVRDDHMICLFNNSADNNHEDMYEIIKSWPL